MSAYFNMHFIVYIIISCLDKTDIFSFYAVRNFTQEQRNFASENSNDVIMQCPKFDISGTV